MNPRNVVFLERTNGMKIGQKFQGFYEYRYDIDPKKLLKISFDNDLICESNLEYNISKSNSTTLKETLKNNGLKVSGKKSELVIRVLENIPHDELKKGIQSGILSTYEEGE